MWKAWNCFARSIAAFGGHVFLVDLDKEKGRRLVAELGAHKADFFVADITTASGIQKSIQSCVVKFGQNRCDCSCQIPAVCRLGCHLGNHLKSTMKIFFNGRSTN